MLEFNASYSNKYSDPEVIDISTIEKRKILIRDKGILKTRKIPHGH
jgi:hypothetical protein